MIPKVPIVSVLESEQLASLLGKPVADLSSVGAEHDPRSGAVISMVLQARTNEGHQEHYFALSPPAAKQLSRALRQAVKDYLNSQETE